MATIEIDGITWKVAEATRDSAVMNDHVSMKQTVVFRLVCERPIVYKDND